MTKHILTSTIAAVALVTVCACNKTKPDNTNAEPQTSQAPATPSAPADQQAVNSPITVTGCLQKEGGLTTTFVVTGVNEPSQQGVGTTGNGTAVEREQLREAERAYRVSPKDNVDMDSMVGKQVRVSGTMARQADLPQPGTAASDKHDGQEMDKISKGDLARIDDATISVVSDSCGGHGAKSSNGERNQPR